VRVDAPRALTEDHSSWRDRWSVSRRPLGTGPGDEQGGRPQTLQLQGFGEARENLHGIVIFGVDYL